MIQLRTTLSVCVLVILAAALVACGGPAEPPSTENGSPSESPIQATTAENGSANRAPAVTDATAEDQRLGPPIAEPSRYYGVYASAERPDRRWFVTEAKRPKYAEQAPEVPPGHLALGAMFGDVAPYHMKTLSETEFEQAWVSEHQGNAVSIEFELDEVGRAVALRFTDPQNADSGRLARFEDLPEGWE